MGGNRTPAGLASRPRSKREPCHSATIPVLPRRSRRFRRKVRGSNPRTTMRHALAERCLTTRPTFQTRTRYHIRGRSRRELSGPLRAGTRTRSPGRPSRTRTTRTLGGGHDGVRGEQQVGRSGDCQHLHDEHLDTPRIYRTDRIGQEHIEKFLRGDCREAG